MAKRKRAARSGRGQGNGARKSVSRSSRAPKPAKKAPARGAQRRASGAARARPKSKKVKKLSPTQKLAAPVTVLKPDSSLSVSDLNLSPNAKAAAESLVQ